MSAIDPQQLAGLLDRIALGDEQALEELYRITRSYLHWQIRRILPGEFDAEEVLQDVYRYVWQNASAFEAQRGGACAWLHMIARSRALDRLRSLQRRPTVSIEDLPLAAGPTESGHAITLHLWRGVLRTIVTQLPEAQKDLIERSFYEGQSHNEIAAATGLPLGTVKTRIRMGICSLRERLTPRGIAA